MAGISSLLACPQDFRLQPHESVFIYISIVSVSPIGSASLKFPDKYTSPAAFLSSWDSVYDFKRWT